ncbi:hypothetical protein [Lapillicoccus sp.]|uniref:hypothetical protein n=1 Tax=Lapillicoccus sp. TaxID=1909287 RepID=UPI0025F64797|nr:hypothetical protein [Lapillicoccus sp.]
MSRHLGLQVSAYVDRRLDAPVLRAFDQHLVACQVCCYAADQERRLLASLRHGATPGLSDGLQSMLLGLGSPGGCGAAQSAPRPLVVRPVTRPVPTVAPAAPALHRSPRRAAMFAGFAASASAAAAIGLAVAGPTAATAVPRAPLTVPRSSSSTSADTAAFLTASRVVAPRAPRLVDEGGR